jgi:LmbE family N-acetylglucosaminyl deacetylase/beta-glucosidase-like glycosyl hydrolase
MKRIVLFLLIFICVSFISTYAQQDQKQEIPPGLDILVFSPHPDDETLGCGGTISKAVTAGKKIKVIFITNGDAYSKSSYRLSLSKSRLKTRDYIDLGKKRRQDAIAALRELGLNEDNLVFLGYPDKGLSYIWEEVYEDSYRSPFTKTAAAPYEKIYGRARQGYNKGNLISDIKELLKEYRPKRIYTPHPVDTHSDHLATTLFVHLSLDELRSEVANNQWIEWLEMFYYLVHSQEGAELTQLPDYQEDVSAFKEQKRSALKIYYSGLSLATRRDYFEESVKDAEYFWSASVDTHTYLKQLQEEWSKISKLMHNQGYNVNFGVVVDVVEDLYNLRNSLVRQRRIYSDNPLVVTELAKASIKGMNDAGIIPVVKHFPGLGRFLKDSHIWLPVKEISTSQLRERDLIPFKALIDEKLNFWVMIHHAIYPSLSDKPASLSSEIQTELLRKELGFPGIIIVDELYCMQALKEYAYQQKIKEPYIGEIVVRAFEAGTDIALLYEPSPEEAEKLILHIIEAVEQAVKQGRLRQKDINASVERILIEKERISNQPLKHLLKKLSLKEKISQKLIFDTYKETELFKKYKLGGIHVRNPLLIREIQKDLEIPMFITAQHEGGALNQYGLNIYTRSAYLIGKEFEGLAIKQGESKFYSLPQRWTEYRRYDEIRTFNFQELAKGLRQKIKYSLIETMDELIELYATLRKTGRVSPNPSNISPLVIHTDGRFQIRPYDDSPIEWLRRFDDQESSYSAYRLLRSVFEEWQKEQDKSREPRISSKMYPRIARLESIKERLEAINIEEENKESVLRVLCLATHPDDEDGEALAYLKHKLNCLTYILLATRGQGSDNETASFLNQDLGFLRSQEMEAAASKLGVNKVYYLEEVDFGYTSSLEETWEKWNHEDALRKMVYFLRLIRPHIIITKHTSQERHGQHQAVLNLAQEAFDLAGNPSAYPEMIAQGLSSWQPLKFYQRSGQGEDRAVIDIRTALPSLNKTIRELAIEALNEHQSQGSWDWLTEKYAEQKIDEIYYELTKSKVAPSQIHTFLEGIERQEPSLQSKDNLLASGIPGIRIADNLHIGLIEANDNTLFVALKTLGHDIERINEEVINQDDLSGFDTIVLGKRAYALLPFLAEANDKLLKFVQGGGNLVVFQQYEKGKLEFPFAPYELCVSFLPISDENAPVSILEPKHTLFNLPNQIEPQDFQGWELQRGLFFPQSYADKYTPLTSCNSDKGEEIQSGYLVGDYGKGTYIFTSFDWHRQLRRFHLGAYKNLANMLAYGRIKKSQ